MTKKARKQTKTKMHGDAYDVEQAEIEPIKLGKDAGDGKPIILRKFTFAFSPDQLKHGTITQQQLEKSVNFKTDGDGTQQEKLKFIDTALWLDELTLIEMPRVTLAPDGKGFFVFATCQAKKGSQFSYNDNPQLLEDAITKKPSK